MNKKEFDIRLQDINSYDSKSTRIEKKQDLILECIREQLED